MILSAIQSNIQGAVFRNLGESRLSDLLSIRISPGI